MQKCAIVKCHFFNPVQTILFNNNSSKNFSKKLKLNTVWSSTTTQCHHSFKFILLVKLFTALLGCCLLCRAPFSNLVHKHTFQTKDRRHWSGSETNAYVKLHVDQQASGPASTVSFHGSGKLMNTRQVRHCIQLLTYL